MNDPAPDTDSDARPVAFISHHSSQEQTARHLKTILERNGVTGWMAPDDIEPGTIFDKAIVDQVRRSDMIVLLFCAKSDQSEHVRRELTLAVDNKKLIYPVRLEDIDAEGLAYWLSGYQWIDWIDRRDDTIYRLIETIKLQANEGIDPTGASSGTVRQGGHRGSRKRAAWIGGGAAVAIAALGAGWFIMSGEAETEFTLLPGNWARQLITHEPIAISESPGAENLFSTLDIGSATGCIGAAEADRPGVSFFDLDGQQNCSMESLSATEDSKMRAEFVCRPEILEGGSVTYALDIAPQRSTKISANGTVTIRDSLGGQSLYEVEFNYFYSGKNC